MKGAIQSNERVSLSERLIQLLSGNGSRRDLGRRAAIALLGTIGLALYMTPAIRAPVVRWGDSEPDLRWAREGTGIWKPLTAEEARRFPAHAPKPGYLLFLRLASSVTPTDPERGIVVVQSFLLWVAIAVACLGLGRRFGFASGLIAYTTLLGFLPVRDSASAIMSEAIAAALFLSLSLVIWEPPRHVWSLALATFGVVALFWIRPNVGGVALFLIVLSWALRKAFQNVAILSASFLVAVVLIWAATARYAGPDSKRSLPYALLVGSAEYNWTPPLERYSGYGRPSSLDTRIEETVANWREALGTPSADKARDIRWRTLHGIFGLDYYDARWSDFYRRLERSGRIWWPLMVLLAIALAASAAFARRPEDKIAGFCALALGGALPLHNLLFSSSPRLILPYLGFFFLVAPRALLAGTRRPLSCAAILTVVGAGLLIRHPEVASWDWGVLESSGVTLQEQLRSGALPRHAPATLHVRIAPVEAGAAELVVSLNEEVLFRGSGYSMRRRPFLTIPLPPHALAENALAPSVLRLTSVGRYDSFMFMIFPVVPPPWRNGAHRLGSTDLSPRSDIPSGALDWWAHEGTDPQPERKDATRAAELQ